MVALQKVKARLPEVYLPYWDSVRLYAVIGEKGEGDSDVSESTTASGFMNMKLLAANNSGSGEAHLASSCLNQSKQKEDVQYSMHIEYGLYEVSDKLQVSEDKLLVNPKRKIGDCFDTEKISGITDDKDRALVMKQIRLLGYGDRQLSKEEFQSLVPVFDDVLKGGDPRLKMYVELLKKSY